MVSPAAAWSLPLDRGPHAGTKGGMGRSLLALSPRTTFFHDPQSLSEGPSAMADESRKRCNVLHARVCMCSSKQG